LGIFERIIGWHNRVGHGYIVLSTDRDAASG
jgi:hypothetical protein